MHALISATGSDWTYGGAILTFVFPMLLFIFVAAALYVAYTIPHLDPGRRRPAERPGLAAAQAVRAPARSGQVAQGGQPGEGGAQPAAGAESGGPEAAGGPATAGAGDQ